MSSTGRWRLPERQPPLEVIAIDHALSSSQPASTVGGNVVIILDQSRLQGIQVGNDLPERSRGYLRECLCAPSPGEPAKGRSSTAVTVPLDGLWKRDEESILRNLGGHRRRVSVDDYLPEGIVHPDCQIRVDGDVLEETEHGRNPLRMDSVLRLLHAQDSADIRIVLQDRKSKKAKSAIGKRPRLVLSAVVVS